MSDSVQRYFNVGDHVFRRIAHGVCNSALFGVIVSEKIKSVDSGGTKFRFQAEVDVTFNDGSTQRIEANRGRIQVGRLVRCGFDGTKAKDKKSPLNYARSWFRHLSIGTLVEEKWMGLGTEPDSPTLGVIVDWVEANRPDLIQKINWMPVVRWQDGKISLLFSPIGAYCNVNILSQSVDAARRLVKSRNAKRSEARDFAASIGIKGK